MWPTSADIGDSGMDVEGEPIVDVAGVVMADAAVGDDTAAVVDDNTADLAVGVCS